MNAYEDGGKIIRDVMQYEAAPLFPDPDGRPGDPAKAIARLTRWTFDLVANTDTFKQELVDDLAGEFPRFDERFAGLTYRHGFFAARSDSSDGFDTLAHVDLKTNTRSVYKLPHGDAVSEPIFVPRSADAPECDGYLLATIYRGAEHRSDLAVFDATAPEKGPIAIASSLIACRSASTAIGVRRRRAPRARRKAPAEFFWMRFVANGAERSRIWQGTRLRILTHCCHSRAVRETRCFA